MSGLEICLVLISIVLIACSYIFSEHLEGKQNDGSGNLGDIDVAAISEEVVRQQIDTVVDNIIDETVERTETALEKLSNEKIMAVSDYSETVINEINKNHNEVMFLYSMLNDKEKDIKNTVRDVEAAKSTVKSLNKTIKEAGTSEDTVLESGNYIEDLDSEYPAINNYKNQINLELNEKSNQRKASMKMIKRESLEDVDPGKNIQETRSALTVDEARKFSNNNQMILELHSKGKSNIEIAKELGLGLGEVRLVIDLFNSKK